MHEYGQRWAIQDFVDSTYHAGDGLWTIARGEAKRYATQAAAEGELEMLFDEPLKARIFAVQVPIVG